MKSIALSSVEYLIVVMAVFPLSFVVILSRGPFSINVEVFSFSLNCSYIVLVLSFKSALGCRGQNHPRLYLQAIWTFTVCPWLYPSSARALDPKAKWAGVTSSLAPHISSKIHIFGSWILGTCMFGNVLFIYLFIIWNKGRGNLDSILSGME